MEESPIEWGRPQSGDADDRRNSVAESHRPRLRVSRVLRADEIGDLNGTPPRPTRPAPPPPAAEAAVREERSEPMPPAAPNDESDGIDGGGLKVSMSMTPTAALPNRRASVIRLGANIDGTKGVTPPPCGALEDANLDSPPGSGIRPPPVAATDCRSPPRRRSSVIRLGTFGRLDSTSTKSQQPQPLPLSEPSRNEVEWEDVTTRLKATALSDAEAEAEAEAKAKSAADADGHIKSAPALSQPPPPPKAPRRASVIRLGKTLDGTKEKSLNLTVETGLAGGGAAGSARVGVRHSRVGPGASMGAIEFDAPTLVRASSIDGEWDGDEYYTPRTVGSNGHSDDAGVASHGHAHARPGGVDGAWHGDQHKAYRDVPRRFSVIRLGKTIDGQPESNRTTHYGLNGSSSGGVRARAGDDHTHAHVPVDPNGSWSSANGTVGGLNGTNGSEAQPHVAYYHWDGTEQVGSSDGVNLGGSGSFSIDGDWNGHHRDEYYRPHETRRKSVIRLGQSFDGTPDNVSMDGSIDLDPHSPRYASNDIDAGVNAYHSYSNAWDGHRSWEL